MSRYSFVIALFAILASCENGRLVGPPDGPAATLTVHGQVSRADGAGIPSVDMQIEARTQGSCAKPRMDWKIVRTDEQGRYEATLFNWGTVYSVCVNVVAIPASGSGFVSDSVQVAPAIMRSTNPDSVRIDLVLQSNS